MRNIRDGTALSLTDDLVSATPQIDSEVLAPTPPQPIVEPPRRAAGGADDRPATGATGRDRRHRRATAPGHAPAQTAPAGG